MFDDVRQLGGQAGLRQSKGKLVTVACLEDLLDSPFTAVFPGLCACYSFFWGNFDGFATFFQDFVDLFGTCGCFVLLDN